MLPRPHSRSPLSPTTSQRPYHRLCLPCHRVSCIVCPPVLSYVDCHTHRCTIPPGHLLCPLLCAPAPVRPGGPHRLCGGRPGATRGRVYGRSCRAPVSRRRGVLHA